MQLIINPIRDGHTENGYVLENPGDDRNPPTYEWIATYRKLNATVIRVGASYIDSVGQTLISRGYLDFTIPIPAGAKIKSAYLYLKKDNFIYSEQTITLRKISASTTYTAENLHNAIASGSAYSSGYNMSNYDLGEYVPFELNATAIKDLKSGAISFGVKGVENPSNYVDFRSLESTYIGSTPYLLIEYEKDILPGGLASRHNRLSWRSRIGR